MDATFLSWVLDLQQEWGSDRALFNLTHRLPRTKGNISYAAGGKSSTDANFSADGHEITLSGISIDSIALLSTPVGKIRTLDDIASDMVAIVDN
jgi:hypothetical protein